MLWMTAIFPLTSRFAGSSRFYRICFSILHWIFPKASFETLEILYIILRKSFHFMEYAFLAYLLYRAFRGVSRIQWRLQWMMLSFMISFVFAMLDECIQIFIRNRGGSLLDVLVDTMGILSVLGVIFLTHRKPTLPAAEFDGKT